MLITNRIVLVLALATSAVACGGGGGLRSPRGRDAGQGLDLNDDSSMQSRGDARTEADGGARGLDGVPGGDDAKGLRDSGIDTQAPDTRAGSGDAADVRPDAGGKTDAVAPQPDAGLDSASATDGRKADGPAVVTDLPLLFDAGRADTRAVDAVPGLQLLAGGLGGAGTQDGTGAGARFCMPTGMVGDGLGNLYLADYCNHSIRQVVPSTGKITTLAGTSQEGGYQDGTGAEARFAAPAGIASDGQGNLFVTDSGTHIIRKIVIATGAVSTVAGKVGESGMADGTGDVARFHIPWGIIHDGAGNLYVTEAGNHTLRKVALATGAVTTIAGSAGNPGNRDGSAASALFNGPRGIALDAGDILVADTGNHAIRKVSAATGVVSTVDKNSFAGPNALATDGAGALYVVDGTDMTLRKMVPATGAVTLIAGDVNQTGTLDGTGAGARFYGPAGVALDGAGDAFLADSSNNLVRKVVLATGAVTTVAGRAVEHGSVDGLGPDVRFDLSQSGGVVSDGQGHLFVADTGNHAIRKVVIATAEVTTIAGGSAGCDVADGTGKDAHFCEPTGIATDGKGNLFVADTVNNAIRKIVIATAAVTTTAGYPGAQGSADGVGAAARFNRPKAIAADGAGNLYVADTENHTIRQVSVASGQVSTLAGSAGVPGQDDGTGALARFNRPAGLVLDGLGSLLVADSDNSTLRKISLGTAVVTTLAGTAGSSGGEDGSGSEARFSDPIGLAIDGMGNLLVADFYNHAIRKVVLDSATVTTVVGSSHRLGVAPGPLPASLSGPIGLAFVAPGMLFITDAENAVLQVQF